MRSSRIFVACLVIAMFTVAATGCSRSAKPVTGSGLSPAERADSVSSESTATGDTTAKKVVSAAGGSKAGTSTGATSGTDSGSAAGNGSGTSTVAKKPAPAGMPVTVIFWNDTSSKKLARTEIVIGAATFLPSTSAASSRKNLGPFVYGKKMDLIVYPDGRSGKKIVVPMMLDRQMIPKSEQDAIHVAISDKTVRVLGNAILNVDQSYPRY